MNSTAKGRPGNCSTGTAQKKNDYAVIIARARLAVDRIAAWSEREEAAYARGYRFACQIWQGECEAAYQRGYDDALGNIEKQQEQLHRDLSRKAQAPSYEELELTRWDGPRSDFGKPRPGDHPGGAVAPW